MTSFSEKSPFCDADALKTTRNFVVDAASSAQLHGAARSIWDVQVVAPLNRAKLLIFFHEHVLIRFQVVLLQ